MNGVYIIFSNGTPFKIVYIIIGLYAVFMINNLALLWIWQEGGGHKLVDTHGLPFFIEVEGKEIVSIFIEARFAEATSLRV